MFTHVRLRDDSANMQLRRNLKDFKDFKVEIIEDSGLQTHSFDTSSTSYLTKGNLEGFRLESEKFGQYERKQFAKSIIVYKCGAS